MQHLPELITDLALILVTAAITTLIFKKIKQPLVLGYIIAGLLVGPNIKLFPAITEYKDISIWAELGVIILLFSLGLEFSFKKLIKVGGSSSITAVFQIIVMLFVGYYAGQLMGWSQMNCFFLGAMLSISSTTIIIRAFEELDVKNKKYARVVFGALIVEDLVAIVLMVLLTTVAVSQQFAGAEMLYSILKLSFFLILWFAGGIYFIPTFLKKVRKLMTDETMLLVALGLCLTMVILAAQAGFSPALGAFIMGSILAETTEAEHFEHLIKPIKDLFGAVFFVSVGMMIDPSVLIEYAYPIGILTLVTIFGKAIASTTGALISGQSLKQSIQTGMSLAQIGEFSFIIATLGLTLNVISPFLYPIIVAVSAITTFTTPYLIKYSGSIYGVIERNVSPKFLRVIENYGTDAQSIVILSDWNVFLKQYALNMLLNIVLLIAFALLSAMYIYPFIQEHVVNGFSGSITGIVISFILTVPFLWALTMKQIAPAEYQRLWNNEKKGRSPLILLGIVRLLIGLLSVGFLLSFYLNNTLVMIVSFAVFAVFFFVFSKRLQFLYDRMEKRFLVNFNERDEVTDYKAKITPWDAHIIEFKVSPLSSVIGKTLEEMAIREAYGVNIIMIEREYVTLPLPSRTERIYPGDIISVVGSDEQLLKLKEIIACELTADEIEVYTLIKNDLVLKKVIVDKQTPLLNKSIKESGIREKSALVVGVERNGERILNPPSVLYFQEGDIVWIAGGSKVIKELF